MFVKDTAYSELIKLRSCAQRLYSDGVGPYSLCIIKDRAVSWCLSSRDTSASVYSLVDRTKDVGLMTRRDDVQKKWRDYLGADMHSL